MIKLFFIILFVIPLNGLCQYPEWINKIPSGYVNDYFIGKGVSKSSRAESISLASEDAIVSVINTGKITISYYETDSIGYFQSGNDMNSSMEIVAKTVREVNISGESKTIKGLKLVETYSEFNRGYYESWVLISVPKPHPESLPSGLSNTLKSVIIPGWGQFTNGEKLKGIGFLTLTAGTVITGFVLNALSSKALKDAVASHTQVRRDFYNEQARTYNTFSIISFITAAGLYIWNVADATATKKEIIYADVKPLRNEFTFNIKIYF